MPGTVAPRPLAPDPGAEPVARPDDRAPAAPGRGAHAPLDRRAPAHARRTGPARPAVAAEDRADTGRGGTALATLAPPVDPGTPPAPYAAQPGPVAPTASVVAPRGPGRAADPYAPPSGPVAAYPGAAPAYPGAAPAYGPGLGSASPPGAFPPGAAPPVAPLPGASPWSHAPAAYGAAPSWGPPEARPGESPRDLLHWMVPIGRSWQSIVAGYLGLLSLLVWVLGPVAIGFALWAFRVAARGGHGRGSAVMGLLGGTLGTVIGLLVLLQTTFVTGA